MDALVWAGLANAVLAAGLAILAALLGRLFHRRPALVHALWLLVLLKLVTPPLVRPGLSWSPAGEPAQVAELPAAEIEPVSSRGFAEPGPAPAPAPEVADAADEPGLATPAWSWQAAVLAVWLAGAAGYWLVAGWRLVRLYRLLGQLPPAPAEVQERVAALAARLALARLPCAWLVPGLAPLPPLVVALVGRPRLLLPAPLWQALAPAQRDALVLHELAHLRRGDHLVRWLELLVLGLYWWNPVAWWASRRLRQAEELCCDAWVVWASPESAADYAAALVETVAYLSAVPSRPLAGVSAASPVVELERRLCMILAARTPRRLSWPAGAVLVLAGLVLLPLVPTLARTEPPARLPSAAVAPMPHPHVHKAYKTTCTSCHDTNSSLFENWNQKHALPPMHAEIVRLMDEVSAHRARLRQAEEKLRQALARFEKGLAKPEPKAPTPTEPRLKSLDQKLERLLKEVESLRRELRPGRSQGPRRAESADVVYINQRTFKIPVQIRPERRNEVREVILYMSGDQGRTWEAYTRGVPGKNGFDFVAKRDGLFYFTLAVVDQQGRQGPPDVFQAPVGQKICVDTIRPSVSLTKGPKGEWLVWNVKDDNLDLSTLRLELRPAGGEWKPMPLKEAAQGVVQIVPPAAKWEARLTVADRAGNTAASLLQWPEE
jgi:beta-lactamase regulating signal transducer with metallopeptidase domain